MYGESNMETYITIHKIDSQWEFAMWLRKLKQGSVPTWRGGVGREMGGRFKTEGTFVYLLLIHVDKNNIRKQQKFDRKQQNSVKQLFFK